MVDLVRREPLRRVPIMVLMAILVLAGILVEETGGGRHDVEIAPVATMVQPEAAPPDATASSWLCPGGAATPGQLTVIGVNSTDFEVPGLLTVYAEDGRVETQSFAVGPQGRIELRPAEVVDAPSSALVEFGSGGVAVEQVIHDGSDLAVSPCSTSAADEWFFAYGTTVRGSELDLVVFNPFPDDAVLDVVFPTEDGVREPEDFRGVIVPARGLTVLEVDPVVTRRERVGVHATTRTGRVVMARRVSRDRVEGVGGLDVRIGLQSPAGEWMFAGGTSAAGRRDSIWIYNPHDDESLVDVELAAVGEEGCTQEIEPVTLTVPGGEVIETDLLGPDRVPRACAGVATVRVISGAHVVAERVQLGQAGLDAMPGSRTQSGRWLLVAGSTANGDEVVAIFNPGAGDVSVSFRALLGPRAGVIPGLEQIEVPAGTAIRVPVGAHHRQAALPLLVEASEEVVVERVLRSTDPLGLASTVGISIRTR